MPVVAAEMPVVAAEVPVVDPEVPDVAAEDVEAVEEVDVRDEAAIEKAAAATRTVVA